MKFEQKYVEKLFYGNGKEHIGIDEALKNFSKLLSNIFYDVEGYEYFNYDTVSNMTGGKAKNLKEVFSSKEDPQRGIGLVFQHGVMTNVNFSIVFFDDRFVTKSIDFKVELPDLSKPKYQKRYVKEMYKMFGEPYRKHYKKIVHSQIKALEKEAEFIK